MVFEALFVVKQNQAGSSTDASSFATPAAESGRPDDPEAAAAWDAWDSRREAEILLDAEAREQ